MTILLSFYLFLRMINKYHRLPGIYKLVACSVVLRYLLTMNEIGGTCRVRPVQRDLLRERGPGAAVPGVAIHF